MAARPDDTSVLVEGPWSHREVSANGVRLHVAEAGSGPLVLLLHGFPQFWWTWRHQLVALADAGFHAVAPDLRGYGASDKTPRGYDAATLAADVAGLIRALGERDAVLVGHDWGGLLAWSVAALQPAAVRRLVVLDMAHPLRMRQALLRDRAQLRASWYLAPFQLPRYGERLVRRNDAAFVGRLLHEWSGPGWPDPEAEARYRSALQIPGVAHSALEHYRWAVRSLPRPDGLRFARALRPAVEAPTLQLHGQLDRCVLPSTAVGSQRYVRGAYQWRLVEGVGHFPHEEAPDLVNRELLDWARRS